MDDKLRVQELDPSTRELLKSHYRDFVKFARFGDVGCLMPVKYKDDADKIRNMAARPDDVWVTTFPRSGTTWTQELVWILMNNFDYETAAKIPLLDRYLFLEAIHVSRINERKLGPGIKIKIPSFDSIVNASSRFIKTHLPLSLLPPNLLETSKVVYVARDPRDVAVSLYHFDEIFIKVVADFKRFWNLFINNSVAYSPYFPHLKEAWALRNHQNMLFIFYEEMKKDLPSCIKRIADFLEKEVTNEQVMKLADHLDIKQFRKYESVNPSWLNEINPDAEGFVRKGVSGGWRDYFDAEMSAQAQRWLRENLADTDLRFPQI